MTEPLTTSDRVTLSVVAPLYFEEACVDAFLTAVLAVLDGMDEQAEIVLADDGSADRTVALVREWIERDPRVKLVELAYNHGKPAAVTAALAHCSGDRVVIMDPDLQDPPTEIPKLVEAIDGGYDLVWGICDEKPETLFNRLGSSVFWFVLERFTGLQIPHNLSTMRIANRAFVERFLLYGESNRFIEGMFQHVGLRVTQIRVERTSRHAGETKFTLRRKVELALTAVCAFSELPLRLTLRGGLYVMLLGVLGVIGIALCWALGVEFQLGWPSVVCTIVFGTGLNIAFLGVIGTYVGNIYREVKHRPIFAVRTTHNIAGGPREVVPAVRPVPRQRVD